MNQERQVFEHLHGKFKHYCPDWDDMAIDETCPEFASCMCEFPVKFGVLRSHRLWSKRRPHDPDAGAGGKEIGKH